MSLTEADIEAIVDRKVQERLESMEVNKPRVNYGVTKEVREYAKTRLQEADLLVVGWREWPQYDTTMQVLKMAMNKKAARDFYSEDDLREGKEVVDSFVDFLKRQRGLHVAN